MPKNFDVTGIAVTEFYGPVIVGALKTYAYMFL